MTRTIALDDIKVLGWGYDAEQQIATVQVAILVVDTGRDLVPGDYLITSDVPGYAMVDPGMQPVAHIFAKVAERVEWARVRTTVAGTARKCKLVSVLFCAFRQQ